MNYNFAKGSLIPILIIHLLAVYNNENSKITFKWNHNFWVQQQFQKPNSKLGYALSFIGLGPCKIFDSIHVCSC